MTSWKLIAGWLLVLAVTTALTWQIVSFADNQVSARPVAVAPSTSSTIEEATTSTSSPTTTTPGDDTSSSSSSSSSTSTSTSSPSSISTSTEAWSVRTIATDGGTVVVRHRPNEVELQAATPLPGFQMEIDDTGPQRVRVEFESDDLDIRVDVEWSDGSLDVDVTGES